MKNDIEKRNLWTERLILMREIYAVGLQILADSQNPSPPPIPDRWKLLDQMWARFAALDPAIHQDPLPESMELRKELEEQAKANQCLFSSLRAHCLELKQHIQDVLPLLQSWSSHHHYLSALPESIQARI